MDFLKKAQSMMSGSKTHTQKPAGQGDDYVDKGLSAIQKKLGMSSNRQTNEAITDAGRNFYEKQTGKKVNPKVYLQFSFIVDKPSEWTDNHVVQQLGYRDLVTGSLKLLRVVTQNAGAVDIVGYASGVHCPFGVHRKAY